MNARLRPSLVVIGCLAKCLVIIFFSASIVTAQDETVPLSQHRKLYEEARAKAASVPRPDLNDADFTKKLSQWSELQTIETKLAHSLIQALFDAWDGSGDKKQIEQELSNLYRDRTAPPISESRHEECVFFSNLVRGWVIRSNVSKEDAAFLAKLCVPHQRLRENDLKAKKNIPTEPWGFEIQDTYSLALARAGQFQQARAENELLLAKLELLIQLGRLPQLLPEQMAEKRSFLIHQALIEFLAGDSNASKKVLQQAMSIATVANPNPEDGMILTEVRRSVEKP